MFIKWWYVLIVISVVIFIGLIWLIKEYSKCYYVQEKYLVVNKESKACDLIYDIKLKSIENPEIIIIPKYYDPHTVKLIILNFGKVTTKNIEINSISCTIPINNELSLLNYTHANWSFLPKPERPSAIPKKIMQVAKNKHVTPNKWLSIQSIQEWNPNYSYEYYDNNDTCIQFIKTHFDEKVINAFNKLIPGAYKADLFRYCYLYVYGGIYIDCKMICCKHLDDLLQDYQLILVNDIGPKAFCNAFICAMPKLQVFKDCISAIVDNVDKEYYGNSPLDITGPTLFYKVAQPYLPQLKHKILYFYHISNGHPNNAIYDGKDKLFNINYPNYYYENCYKFTAHYSKAWHLKNVYN